MTFQCVGTGDSPGRYSSPSPPSSHPWGVWALLLVSPSQSGFVPSAQTPWVVVLGTQVSLRLGVK